MPPRKHDPTPDHDRLHGRRRPLLGAASATCDLPYHAHGDGSCIPTCECALGSSEWRYGVDDQSQWHRDGESESWRQLSAADARLRHSKEARASTTVRRTR